MVGVNAIFSINLSNKNEKFSGAQEKLLHHPSYKTRFLIEDDRLSLGSTAYDEYPITVVDDPTFFIALEGMIYNLDDAAFKEGVLAIAHEMREGSNYKESVLSLIAAADGEFVVYIYDRVGGDLLVFNDSLGRLPIFWYRDDEKVVFSREISFIRYLIDRPVFSKWGLTEYLLYGFSLGERTLLEGVERLFPATAVLLRGSDHSVTKEQLAPLNLDKREVIKGSYPQIAEELRRSFEEGLGYRVGKLGSRKPLISLSGGLDSRATLAGLIKLGVRPSGYTYDQVREHQPQDVREVDYTQRIADGFGIPLTHISPSRDLTHEDYVRLVDQFDAAEPLPLASLVNVEEQVAQREGHNVVWYTGLYGGELLRYLNLTSGLRSDEDLARYLFTTPDRFRYPSEKVGAMLHVPEEEMMEHLRGHIATYPERDPYGKYIHFKTEMDIRFTGMGEDRNRAFFWIVTPFYTKPFVTTVRRIGERSKNTLLFRDFLHALDPRTCVVPYFNNKLPLTNRLRLRLSNVAERAVRNPSLRKLAWRVVLFRNRSGTPALDRGKEDMRAWALDLLETSAVIREHFSGPATREILLGESDPDRINRVLALFIYMDIVGVAGESTVPLQNASSADHHYNRSG